MRARAIERDLRSATQEQADDERTRQPVEQAVNQLRASQDLIRQQVQEFRDKFNDFLKNEYAHHMHWRDHGTPCLTYHESKDYFQQSSAPVWLRLDRTKLYVNTQQGGLFQTLRPAGEQPAEQVANQLSASLIAINQQVENLDNKFNSFLRDEYVSHIHYCDSGRPSQSYEDSNSYGASGRDAQDALHYTQRRLEGDRIA